MKKSIIQYLWLSGDNKLPVALRPLFSVLWMGVIDGSTLIDESGNGNDITITGKDFSTSYIPSTSTATFSLANSAPLKVDDDWDGLFFTDAGAVKQVTPTELNNNDYVRTLVRYSDSSPYNIQWIGLLDDSVTLTTEQEDLLHRYFRLGLFWSGTLNTNGFYKENRPMQGIGYKDWNAAVEAGGLVKPPLAVLKSFNKFTLEIRNRPGNLDTRADKFFLWRTHDLSETASRIPLFGVKSKEALFPTAITKTLYGYEANGIDQSLNLNFNPTEDGVNYTLNRASFFTFQYKVRTKEAATIVGCPSGSSLLQIRASSGGTGNTRINVNSNAPLSFTYNSIQFIALARSAASGAGSVRVKRGATINSYDVASTALPNVSIHLFRSPLGEWGDQGLSCAGFADSYTDDELGYWETAVQNHINRVG